MIRPGNYMYPSGPCVSSSQSVSFVAVPPRSPHHRLKGRLRSERPAPGHIQCVPVSVQSALFVWISTEKYLHCTM